MITDKKAEEPEQRGLWRRAVARWQEFAELPAGR